MTSKIGRHAERTWGRDDAARLRAASPSGTIRYHDGMPDARPVARLSESLDPVLDFMRLLWTIEHGLQSTSKRMENSLGITGPQRLVLRVVSQFPDLSAVELAEIVRLHPSTLTGVIQRLVDKQLLVRERDPLDGRRMRLRAKQSAARFTRVSPGTVEAAVQHVLSSMPATQVKHARAVLAAVAASLDNVSRE